MRRFDSFEKFLGLCLATLLLALAGCITFVVQFQNHQCCNMLLEVSKLEQSFFKAHGRYASTFAELGANSVVQDNSYNYTLSADSAGFRFTMFNDGTGLHLKLAAMVDQDGNTQYGYISVPEDGRLVWLPTPGEQTIDVK